ncbi:MAG: hypothetical protein BWY80_00160 [Firmicutes bacterium ADurb.Bin456]|nr:MAG: hypothetical protein BWY80_00160 [Firmicutes bacterium ADurb.Bin456]
MEALFTIKTDRVYLGWGPARSKKPAMLAGGAPVTGRLFLRKLRHDLAFLEVKRSGVPDAAAQDPEQTAGPLLFE